MGIDFAKCRQHLKDFDFSNLFREELGWELNDQILSIEIETTVYCLEAIAEKRGFVVFKCLSSNRIPKYAIRRKIEAKVAKSVREHLIIYTDTEQATQTWQWVKRELGKPSVCREHTYTKNQSGDALLQKIRHLAFSLQEEAELKLFDVISATGAAFYAEKVTKRFYDSFKKELDSFMKFIKGIPDEDIQSWYASVILNRLMFIYFIQKKEFLDGDSSYLQNKLVLSKLNAKDRYYYGFLCPLFFEGFAKNEKARSTEMNKLLGKVPYLNGGLFLKHQVEKDYPDIDISDKAFEELFSFFEQYNWHLDERPLRADNEINPDVLGYIFEKYINQKQMGAYYTKEDITSYISKNTIIPFIFDKSKPQCKIAFEGEYTIWDMLTEDPDRYIYDAIRHGVEKELPDEIAAGINDISKRTEWDNPAPEEYALPTEIWREMVARHKHYQEVYEKLAKGEIRSINDFITYNMDITQFLQDVIQNCEGPELLRAFWKAINSVTILDPACGSGAFLFAALNILESLYEGCLQRMRVFIEELERPDEKHQQEKYSDFREILEKMEKHPNEPYFIFKSIIINNLYGVDIIDEAVEICKLRMFLKLVAQVDDVDLIEPLPDIDFNVRAGNSLLGYATYDEVKRAVTSRLDFEGSMEKIEEKSEMTSSAFKKFRSMQLVESMDSLEFLEAKKTLQKHLGELENELNRYLASEYSVNVEDEDAYEKWRHSHKPLHWFVDFYDIMKKRGFDVIIGNPPYVEYSKVKDDYTVKDYFTEKSANLYPFFIERSLKIVTKLGRCGMIIPISAFSNNSMESLQVFLRNYNPIWVSSFHQRPAQLFSGVLQRLSIFLLTNDNDSLEKVFTTAVNRWYSEARDFLFENLRFMYIQQNRQMNTLKVGSPVEDSIMLKYLLNEPIKKYLTKNKNGVNCIYYRTAGGGYWWTFLNSPFETDSLSNKKASFVKDYDSKIIMASLNSTLFWWYYFINYDLFNLKDYMIFNFRFTYPSDQGIREKLITLSETLEEEYLNNSVKYLIRSKTRGENYTLKYQNRLAKPSINEIDEVLAKHYGFTDEELDFIINYDIKYRMGFDSS